MTAQYEDDLQRQFRSSLELARVDEDDDDDDGDADVDDDATGLQFLIATEALVMYRLRLH